MSELTIQGSKVVVKASVDTMYSPSTDYLLVAFGPLSIGMYNSDERKAFIAALQAADAELDQLRGKPPRSVGGQERGGRWLNATAPALAGRKPNPVFVAARCIGE